MSVARAHTPRTRNVTAARTILVLTAVVALAGIGLEMWTAHGTRSWLPVNAGYRTTFGPGWAGSLNRLAFFTAQSNLFIAVVSLVVAVRPDRPSRLLAFLRLCAMVDISLTGLVYVMVLAGPNLGVPFPWEVIASTTLEHVVAPLLAWAGWFLAPTATTWRSLALCPLVPVAYVAGTLVRGALVDWYPYTFLDVPALGYQTVLANAGLVGLLLPVVAGALVAAQRLVSPRPAALPATPARPVPAPLPAAPVRPASSFPLPALAILRTTAVPALPSGRQPALLDAPHHHVPGAAGPAPTGPVGAPAPPTGAPAVA